jgi:hypothetical protein
VVAGAARERVPRAGAVNGLLSVWDVRNLAQPACSLFAHKKGTNIMRVEWCPTHAGARPCGPRRRRRRRRRRRAVGRRRGLVHARAGVLATSGADWRLLIWDAGRSGAPLQPIFRHLGHRGVARPVLRAAPPSVRARGGGARRPGAAAQVPCFHWLPGVPLAVVSVDEPKTSSATVQIWRMRAALLPPAAAQPAAPAGLGRAPRLAAPAP